MSELGDMLRASTADERPLIEVIAGTEYQAYRAGMPVSLYHLMRDPCSYFLENSLGAIRAALSERDRQFRRDQRKASAELEAINRNAKAIRA